MNLEHNRIPKISAVRPLARTYVEEEVSSSRKDGDDIVEGDCQSRRYSNLLVAQTFSGNIILRLKDGTP